MAIIIIAIEIKILNQIMNRAKKTMALLSYTSSFKYGMDIFEFVFGYIDF
jgi:hypothetical protein